MGQVAGKVFVLPQRLEKDPEDINLISFSIFEEQLVYQRALTVSVGSVATRHATSQTSRHIQFLARRAHQPRQNCFMSEYFAMKLNDCQNLLLWDIESIKIDRCFSSNFFKIIITPPCYTEVCIYDTLNG